MDEQKDLSVNNEKNLSNDNISNNDNSVNNEVPNVEENADTSNGNDDVNKAGNGYRGLASSNREAFSRGLSDNYNERIARNQANLNASRARAASSHKMKEGHEDENMKANAHTGESNFEDKTKLDKAKDKVDVLRDKGELAASKIDKARAGMYAVTNPKEAAKMFAKAQIRGWILGIVSFILSNFLTITPILIAILVVLGLFSSDSQASGGSLAVGDQESGFTISATSLSKTEFKNKIQEYANSNPQWQVFADNANDYYDYAKAKQVNPELVVVVADKEGGGYTTSGANNYWGLECPNGASYCGSYGSFMEGARKLIDSASKYSTLREWFEDGSYSFIGYFWYNPGSWGEGGCKYAKYIYPDGLPERVQKACSGSLCECLGESVDGPAYRNWVKTGNNSRPECTPTLEEDQEAYTTYLIKEKMGKSRERIFGLKFEEGVTNTFYKTGEVVEDYVNWMIALAADDTRGYSQSTRYMNPNVDCSSFVYYGLLNGAGFTKDELGNSAFTTTNMIGILQKLGFKVYSYEEDKLIRGDILWKNGHTEVYIGDGKNVGAHTDYDGINGDGNGKEVNVASNYTGWTYYIRYVGNKD